MSTVYWMKWPQSLHLERYFESVGIRSKVCVSLSITCVQISRGESALSSYLPKSVERSWKVGY